MEPTVKYYFSSISDLYNTKEKVNNLKCNHPERYVIYDRLSITMFDIPFIALLYLLLFVQPIYDDWKMCAGEKGILKIHSCNTFPMSL